MNLKRLITGAASFIGSHLSEKLVAEESTLSTHLSF